MDRDLQSALARVIPADATVLEAGSGLGDLLASLPNAVRKGIDFLPEMVDRARARHPGITFDVTIYGSDRVVAAVREGRTDIGLAFYPPAECEVCTVFRMREPLVALMSRRHPLAGKPRVTSWTAICSRRWPA